MTIRPSEIGGTAAYLDVGTGSNEIPTNDDLPVKAWINFNGTGTIAINASRGVSSIADYAVGDYEVFFDSGLMPDANYAVAISAAQNSTGTGMVSGIAGGTVYAQASFRTILTGASNNAAVDCTTVSMIFTR